MSAKVTTEKIVVLFVGVNDETEDHSCTLTVRTTEGQESGDMVVKGVLQINGHSCSFNSAEEFRDAFRDMLAIGEALRANGLSQILDR